MLIQTAINMKCFLTIFILIICFHSNFAQNNSSFSHKRSNDLYIVYDDKYELNFKKSTEILEDDYHAILYYLRIPNQNDPRVIYNFKGKDSTGLEIIYKGGNGSDYDYNFFYNSKEHEKVLIEKDRYLNKKLFMGAILSSNLEVFYQVLKKADKIYILEKTSKKGFRYIAREVNYTRASRL